MYILALNPGSTSTKLAIYEDDKELLKEALTHSKEELAAFASWKDQLGFRTGLVKDFIEKSGYTVDMLGCVVSRGGSPPGIKAGATRVSERLTDALLNRPLEPHPASLGPVIGARIAEEAGVPAYVYDPITSDELSPIAKMSGIKEYPHNSMSHMLNTHAMGIAVAEELGVKFEDMTFITAHIGGGNSMQLWHKGHPIDVIPGDACAFSAERCGFFRGEKLLEIREDIGYDACIDYFHGKGGVVSHLGTNDLRDVEKMIQDGDSYALEVEQAMVYHLSKSLCSLLPIVGGAIDGIIITGGGAFWKRLTDELTEKLSFLGIPIYIRPGERELDALAAGALRVMRGEETAHEYEG